MIFKIKRFSTIINAKGVNNRKYDQDLNRLQKGKTQRELNSPNVLNREMAKVKSELNNLSNLKL
jgi:hypothetical protein